MGCPAAQCPEERADNAKYAISHNVYYVQSRKAGAGTDVASPPVSPAETEPRQCVIAS